MSDLYVCLIYLAILLVGMTAPFVFGLGYVWVDTFYPQYVATDLLDNVPVSEIMAIATVAGYLLADRRSPPRVTAVTVLTLLMAVWVTLTTTWAVVPVAAWIKWDWAFKTIVFSTFLPFLFRSRVQIEALLLVYMFSALAHILPVGIKSMISGGRYGIDLGLLGNNIALSESSWLATISIMFIPLYLFFRRHSVLLPDHPRRGTVFLGLIVISVVTAIGTVARTAVVGFAVVAATLWLRSRRKLIFALGIAAIAVVGYYTTSSSWDARIATIGTYKEENSALTRLLVWRWTLDFVQEHPLGGGFDAYRINVIEAPHADGSVTVEHGRAFHSTYFEMLGEHGWVGLGLFLTIAARSFWVFRSVARRTRGIADLAWCHDLAGALQCAMATLFACCAFIGVGFQATFWYIFALSTCLSEYVRRSELATAGAAGSQAVAPAGSGGMASGGQGGGLGGTPSGMPGAIPGGASVWPGGTGLAATPPRRT
jgi:probable O-glycosylation ligase (exosortase A-associated)